MSEIPQNRNPDGTFGKGNCANPGGRKQLTEEQKEMKNAALGKAIEIMCDRINDVEYVGKLKPIELNYFLTLIFDRCGLPKVTNVQHDIDTPDQNGIRDVILDKLNLLHNVHKSTPNVE
jgi:hypothetical protein